MCATNQKRIPDVVNHHVLLATVVVPFSDQPVAVVLLGRTTVLTRDYFELWQPEHW